MSTSMDPWRIGDFATQTVEQVEPPIETATRPVQLASSEPWPDPDDVRDWLAVLEAGIQATEARLAAEREHLEVCRQATTAAPSEEATRRLCLLMHGEVIKPAPLARLNVEPASTWTPPTDEQKREQRLAEAKLRRERDLAEQRRRIEAAERITGIRYEGLSIEQLKPTSDAWRANVPSGDLHRYLSGAVDNDDEAQRGLREAARLGLTPKQVIATNPPNLEIGRQATRAQEVPANPQHQDEEHGG